MKILLIAVAIIPVILILTFIRQKDKNKEPIGLLIKLFFAGAVSCFLVVQISQLIALFLPFMQIDISAGDNTFLDVFLYSFVGVALIEEVCKFAMTYAFGYYHKDFDEVYDIIVYAIFVALGFAGFENILYVVGSGQISLGISRGLTAVPGHACDGLFMGYYLSIAKIYAIRKNKTEERINILKSIFIPTLLHGIYDFCCFYGNQYIIIVFIIFIITMDIISLRKINYMAKNNVNIFELKKEPEVLTETLEKNVRDNISTNMNSNNVNDNNANINNINNNNINNNINSINNISNNSSSVQNSTKSSSDYFTFVPHQPRPSTDWTGDNFKFEGEGVPYIPNYVSGQILNGVSEISKEQSSCYNKIVPEGPVNQPIPEISPDRLNAFVRPFCVYCGSELTGEYCTRCGRKVNNK